MGDGPAEYEELASTVLELGGGWRLRGEVRCWILDRWKPNSRKPELSRWKAFRWYDTLGFFVKDFTQLRLRTAGARTRAELRQVVALLEEDLDRWEPAIRAIEALVEKGAMGRQEGDRGGEGAQPDQDVAQHDLSRIDPERVPEDGEEDRAA